MQVLSQHWLQRIQKQTVQISKNLKMQVHNVRKLHFHANHLRNIYLPKTKNSSIVYLVLGLVVLQKTVFNH